MNSKASGVRRRPGARANNNASRFGDIRGKRIKPPSLPPQVQIAHYNSATLIHRSSGDVELSVNDIANELRDQYGLFATDSTNRIPIGLRLLSFHFWYLDSVLPSQFQVLVRDLANFAEIARLSEFPARNQWGRVGYVWAPSQQIIQHNHDDTTNKPLKIDVTSSAAWLLHVHVLWRPLNGESYTSSYRDRAGTSSSAAFERVE